MSKKKIFGVVVGLLIVGFVVISIGVAATSSTTSNTTPVMNTKPAMSTDEIKSSAITPPYDELIRNEKDYVGKIVHYDGQVSSVQDVHGDVYRLAILIDESYFDRIHANYEGERLLDRDIVEFWGVYTGIHQYQSLAGQQTVPDVDILMLERTGRK